MASNVNEVPGHGVLSPGTLCNSGKALALLLREAVMTPFNYKHHPVCKEEVYTR